MNILITGANRGLGLEFVRRFAARGETVFATARDLGDCPELSAESALHPDRVRLIELDVTSPESTCKLAGALADETIDLLINNAGHMGAYTGVGKLDYANMELCFRINAIGPLRVVEAVADSMRRSQVRRIVNMSSKMGSIAENTSGGAYAYRMSKAALNMANKSLSLDLGPEGFVCVVLHPGWVLTRMGGPNALIDAATSIDGMIARIDELRPEHNGKFIEWSGGEIPW